MKKVIFLLLIITTVHSSNAQMTFGIKGGINLASVKETGSGLSSTTSNRTAFLLGVFGNFQVSDHLKVQPELAYSGMGGSILGQSFQEEYLIVPVVGQYFLTEKLYLQAGPQLGLLMSAKAAGTDIKSSFKTTDLQLLIGGGYHLTDNISIDARYGFSLGSISTGSYAAYTDKNRAFSFTVAYAFK